ncbi:MAG: AAA family ATPase [Paracoccus sp. (in: a-proteobacteria)]
MNGPTRHHLSPKRMSPRPERLDSEEFVQLLRRNLWLIILVVFAAMAGTAWYLSRQTPLFRAEAAMALTASEVRISQVDTQMEVYDLTRAQVETELDRLRSRNFAEEVAVTLDLFDNTEFLPAIPDGPSVDSPQRKRAVLDRLLAAYRLNRLGESFVITVIAEAPSAELAAAIANAVVENFVILSLEKQAEGIEKNAEYLRRQIESIGEELTVKQMEMARFIRENVLDDEELPERLRRERTQTVSVLDVMDARADADSPERERLQAELDNIEAQLAERTHNEMQLSRLERGTDLLSSRYQTMVERLSKLEPQRDQVQADARQITRAEVPYKPFWPNIPTTLALALPASLLLGFILALLRSTMNRQIWNGGQATHVSNLPNLGNLPRLPRQGWFRRYRSGLFVNQFPQSEFSEAIRTLLTVWAGQAGNYNASRVCMITSSLPHEGKSTVATSMAAIAAQDDLKVLLLDFDIRRFGASRIVGGQMPVSMQTLQQIAAGAISPEDAELSSHEEYGFNLVRPDDDTRLTPRIVADFEEHILPLLKQHYDLIIIDTPPALGIADAARLGTLADDTLIVIRAGKTPERALRHCIERLEDSGVRLAGTVINDIESRRYRQMNLGGSYAYY